MSNNPVWVEAPWMSAEEARLAAIIRVRNSQKHDAETAAKRAATQREIDLLLGNPQQRDAALKAESAAAIEKIKDPLLRTYLSLPPGSKERREFGAANYDALYRAMQEEKSL